MRFLASLSHYIFGRGMTLKYGPARFVYSPKPSTTGETQKMSTNNTLLSSKEANQIAARVREKEDLLSNTLKRIDEEIKSHAEKGNFSCSIQIPPEIHTFVLLSLKERGFRVSVGDVTTITWS